MMPSTNTAGIACSEGRVLIFDLLVRSEEIFPSWHHPLTTTPVELKVETIRFRFSCSFQRVLLYQLSSFVQLIVVLKVQRH